jgi:hypothetical protein
LTKPGFGSIIKESEVPWKARPEAIQGPLLVPERSCPQASEIGAMKKTIPSVALTLVWTTLAAGMAVVRADEATTSAEEKVLKGKGLTKNDRKFLLEEAPAIEKYEQAKSLYTDYQKALNRYAVIAQYDDAVQTMQMEQQTLQQQVNALQMQINSAGSNNGRMQRYVNMQTAPLRQQQSQARAMMNQINSQLQASKGQAPKADDRKTVPAQVEKTRQAYIDCVRELSELVAPLLTKYHELALDKSVTDSLDSLRHRTTLNYKLGPSDPLVAASKIVQDVKKHTAHPSKSASKKKAKAKTP